MKRILSENGEEKTGKQKKPRRRSRMTAVDYAIYVILALFAFITFYQIWYVIIGSFSNGQDYQSGGVFLVPRAATMKNYEVIFKDKTFWSAYRNTIVRTITGVGTALIFTAMVAYAMRSRHLRCRTAYYWIFILTMFFSGGIIPMYLLIRVLGLYDSFWVYIIPAIFSVYNMIIISNFYGGISESLYEAAELDGASELQIWWQIYMPLSKPVLATVSLWLAVNHWNSYMGTMLYTNAGKYTNTLQYYLKHLINSASSSSSSEYADYVSAKTIAFAAIVVALIPIMAFFPTIQKHFNKGVMVGSLKG